MAPIVKAPRPMRAVWVVAALALSACGAAQAPMKRGDTVVIRIDPAHSIDDVTRAAHAVAGGREGCILVWGDVVTQPVDALRVRLEWAALEHIDGWVLCGKDAELVLLDPRARHLAVLYYRDRTLYVGQPAAGGIARLDRTTLSIKSDGPAPCLSVFDPDSSDRNVPAFEVLRVLRDVPRDFLIAAWPVQPAKGALAAK